MNEYVHGKVLSMHLQVFSMHGRDLLDDTRERGETFESNLGDDGKD
jgi:hypothetical protein